MEETDRRIESRRRQSEQIDNRTAAQMVDLSRAYGPAGMSVGAMEALAKEGFGASDIQSQQLAQLEAERALKEPDSSIWGKIRRGGKSLVRGSIVAAESLWEEGLMRPFRTAVGAAEMAQQEVHGRDVKSFESREGSWREFPAFVKNLDDAYRQSGESVGTRIVRKWVNDEPVELGAGFVPRGIADEARHEAETNLQFQGEPISPGRLVAGGTFFEPGTKPYNVASGTIDFAAQIWADPAFLALKAGSKQAAIRRTFGAIDAHRKDVDVQKYVDNFLNKSKAGQNLTEEISKTDSFYDIWKMLGEGHGARRHAKALRGVEEPGEVTAYLRDVLGKEIRTRPSDPTNLRNRFANTLDDLDALPVVRRFFHDVPKERLNVEDLDDATLQLDKYMINAGLGKEARAKHLNKLADVDDVAGPGSDRVIQVWDVVKGMAKDIDESLQTKWGKDAKVTQKLTRVFDKDLKEARRYLTRENGGDLVNNFAPGQKVTQIDGKAMVDPSPHLLSEYINRQIPLPNFREIRRAASHIGPMLDAPGINGLIDKTSWLMTKVWKPIQLARIAWTTRVVGEEQVRIAAAGLDSAFSNPMSWIAYAVGRKGNKSALGQVWDDLDEFQSAMSRGSAGWMGSHKAGTVGGEWVQYRKGEEFFRDAAAEELRQLANDPLARAVAGQDIVEDTIVPVRFDPDMGDDVVEVMLPGAVHSLPPPASGKVRLFRGGKNGRFFSDDPAVAAAFGQSPARHGDEVSTLRYVDVEPRHVEKYKQGPEAVNDLTGSEAVTYKLPTSIASDSIKVPQNQRTIDDIKDAFWDGDFAAHRNKLTQGANREKRVLVDDAVAREEGERLAELGVIDEPWQSAREASDHYVDSIMRRISEKTGENPDLINAIATRKLGDVSLRAGDGGKDVAKALEAYEDSLPTAVKGPRALVMGEQDSAWERGIEIMFDTLMSQPTNKLSRSPAFRQFYWSRIRELSPWMDNSVRAKMVKAAKENNLTDIADDLAKAKVGTGGQFLDPEQIDQLAKSHALDSTRGLLYSLDKRGQWADIARNIFPFGEAWKEVLGTWARLSRQRPQNIRRAQQAIDGARGSGFFYTDENGEERFNYGAFGLTGALAGAVGGAVAGGSAGGPLGAAIGAGAGALGLGTAARQVGQVGDQAMIEGTGFASGLNLVATGILPGFGPVVQWPVAQFLPDAPKWDWIRDAVLPFGEERAEGETLGELLDNNLPAYFRDIVQGFSSGAIDERMWNNTVAEIAKAKVLSGEFSRDEVNENVKAASKQAKYLYIIKGLARAVLPTGPNLEFSAKDKNGEWARTQVFANFYRDLVEETGGDHEEATQIFYEKFGLDPLLLSTPKSKAVRERAVDVPGARWERENSDLVEQHRDVIGFFAPEEPAADFDYNAYLKSIEAGDRVELTAEQQLLFYNNTLGWAQYNNVRDQLIDKYGENNERLNEWLRMYKSKLKEEYPGYDSINRFVPEGLETEDLIAELEKAVTESERLAQTDAGQGLQKYLQLRNQALERSHGVDLSGKTDERLRAWLHLQGEAITKQHPEFTDMWQRVLLREVED